MCKTDPDPIWMAWSGFGQTHLVQKQAGVQESSGPVSGRTQPARYQFSTFRFGSVLPQTSRIILCKTSPDPFTFWLIVSGFGQTDPARKQSGVQEPSGPLLANASQPILIGCESNPACLLGIYLKYMYMPVLPCSVCWSGMGELLRLVVCSLRSKLWWLFWFGSLHDGNNNGPLVHQARNGPRPLHRPV